jgi:hypothetical protein
MGIDAQKLTAIPPEGRLAGPPLAIGDKRGQ